MMEFYKLNQLIHFRTDYLLRHYKLTVDYRKSIEPEKVAEEQEKAHDALRSLYAATALMYDVLGGKNDIQRFKISCKSIRTGGDHYKRL